MVHFSRVQITVTSVALRDWAYFGQIKRSLVDGVTLLSRLHEARLSRQIERHAVLLRCKYQKGRRNPKAPVEEAHVETDEIGAVCVGVAVDCAAERMGDLVQDDIGWRRAVLRKADGCSTPRGPGMEGRYMLIPSGLTAETATSRAMKAGQTIGCATAGGVELIAFGSFLDMDVDRLAMRSVVFP